MKKITLLLLLITLTSCYSYQEVNKELDILIAARKRIKKKSSDYIIEVKKNKITLLDSVWLTDDAKFTDSKHLTFFGDKIIDISSKDKRVKSTSSPFVETFSALALADNIVVTDSIHYSFFTDAQVKENRYKLLGYNLNLDKKLFSIDLTENDFKFNKYGDIGNLRYIYYKDIFPKSASAKKYKIRSMIFDLKENTMTTFSSFSKPVSKNRKLIFNNSRYLRREKNQKISLLNVYLNTDDNSRSCVIVEYDYVNNVKSIIKEFTLDREMTNGYKHRIYNDRIFILTDNAIYEIVDNKQKVIYENKDFKLLDFYIR